MLLLTGYEYFEYAQKAVQYRAFDFLLKPVTTKRLLQAVKMCIRDRGNLVENAVEACMSIEDSKRLIVVKTEMKGNQLVLMIKNTSQHEIIEKEHQFYSTKHKGMGIGLESVKRVTEKYKGQMKVDYDENHFSVFILLQAL